MWETLQRLRLPAGVLAPSAISLLSYSEKPIHLKRAKWNALAPCGNSRVSFASSRTKNSASRYGVGRGNGVGRGRGVTLGVAVGDWVAVGVAEGVIDGVTVGVADGVTDGVTVGVIVGVTVGVGVGEGVGPPAAQKISIEATGTPVTS